MLSFSFKKKTHTHIHLHGPNSKAKTSINNLTINLACQNGNNYVLSHIYDLELATS
jgi:hypothetical protein